MDILTFNELQAVAAIFRADESGEPSAFLGTCFAFRQKDCFLTANHCVADVDGLRESDRSTSAIERRRQTIPEAELFIVHPYIKKILRVQEVIRHKTADIALVRSDPIESEDAHAFLICTSDYSLGTECAAYGFSKTIFGDAPDQPIARLFKCYFQRFMSYESLPLGYSYEAAELNIACPSGLSGGPVFRTDRKMVICGLVTENLTSATARNPIEETQKGAVITKVYRTDINYGVCLLLADVKDWLNEHIPKPRKTDKG